MKLATLLISTFFLISCVRNKHQSHISDITSLPSLNILCLDSVQTINTKNVTGGLPTIFIYFNPECEHCQKETGELLTHAEQLSTCRIWMISNDSKKNTKYFYDRFRIDTAKFIFVGLDDKYSFLKTFLPQSLPFFAIYNRSNQLKKIYNQPVNISLLVATVKNSSK